MIRAGEAGGALEIVMLRLTEFMERAKDLRETVKSALVYPAILIMVASFQSSCCSSSSCRSSPRCSRNPARPCQCLPRSSSAQASFSRPGGGR